MSKPNLWQFLPSEAVEPDHWSDEERMARMLAERDAARLSEVGPISTFQLSEFLHSEKEVADGFMRELAKRGSIHAMAQDATLYAEEILNLMKAGGEIIPYLEIIKARVREVGTGSTLISLLGAFWLYHAISTGMSLADAIQQLKDHVEPMQE